MTKPPWSTISVYPSGDAAAPLTGRDRLAVLALWLRGEPPTSARFLELAGARAMTSPTDVGWQGFPLEEALEAAEDLRRRQSAA